MIQVSPVRRNKKCSLLFPFAVSFGLKSDDNVTQECALYAVRLVSDFVVKNVCFACSKQQKKKKRREKKTILPFEFLNTTHGAERREQQFKGMHRHKRTVTVIDFDILADFGIFCAASSSAVGSARFSSIPHFVIYQIDKSVHKTKIWSIWLLSFEIVIWLENHK